MRVLQFVRPHTQESRPIKQSTNLFLKKKNKKTNKQTNKLQINNSSSWLFDLSVFSKVWLFQSPVNPKSYKHQAP